MFARLTQTQAKICGGCEGVKGRQMAGQMGGTCVHDSWQPRAQGVASTRKYIDDRFFIKGLTSVDMGRPNVSLN